MSLHIFHYDWRPVTATLLGLWAAIGSLVASLDLSQGAVAGYTATFAGAAAAAIYVWSQWDKARQKSQQERDEAARKSQQAWDELNKDSISAKLEKALDQQQESIKNQEAMRASLHALRKEAQSSNLEATSLREQTNETTAQLIAATQEISRLTAEIVNLRKQSAGQPEKTATAIMAAIGRSQESMPVYQTPASAPAPKPEAKP